MTRHSLLVVTLLAFGCSSASAGGDNVADGGSEAGEDAGGSSGTGGKSTGGSEGARGGSSGVGSKAGSSSTGGASATGGTGGSAEGGSAATGTGGSTSGGANSGSGGASGGGAGSAGAPIANHTNPLNQERIDAFVAAHNAARARTDLDPLPDPALPPVTWDAVLADAAYNYLSQCQSADGQLVDHNDDRTKDYRALGGTDSVGENIYASTGASVEPAAAVDTWMGEKSTYDYAANNIKDAGHYTQVVWRGSVRIGCAIVNCPNARYYNTVLCDYAPAGNNTSQKPY